MESKDYEENSHQLFRFGRIYMTEGYYSKEQIQEALKEMARRDKLIKESMRHTNDKT